MNKKKIYRSLMSGLFLFIGMLLLSCLLLSILSMVVWKTGGNEKLISGGIIAIYIITAVFGGFMMGKLFGKQKFLWGFLTGFLYFAILLLVGVLFYKINIPGNSRIFPGFMICSIAGMFGGMLSPGKN